MAKVGLALVRKKWFEPPPADVDAGRLLDEMRAAERTALFAALFPRLGAHLERLWTIGRGLPYQSGGLRRSFRSPSDPLVTRPSRLARLEGVLHALLAAVIEGGGREADDIFGHLVATTRGATDPGSMGRHVTRALLTASRPEGWAAVEQLLLAAQREEGLRQVVLESVDEAQPEAFRRMLRLIAAHDLGRFSATSRAMTVWLGL